MILYKYTFISIKGNKAVIISTVANPSQAVPEISPAKYANTIVDNDEI